MKKLLITSLLAGLLAMSTSAFAATRAEVIAAAKSEIPAGVFMYDYKEDASQKYVTEIKFRDPKTLLDYEVEVDRTIAKVLEVEIKGSNDAKSTTLVKTHDDIEKIILAEYPDAQKLVIKLEQDRNRYEYEATFTTPKYFEVELELNPVTGAIAKRELKYR